MGKLTNNGHAPTLTIDRSKGTAQISGGPLGDEEKYELLQFHFHFGLEKDKGSEHTVQRSEDEDSEQYSGEVYSCILIFFYTNVSCLE